MNQETWDIWKNNWIWILNIAKQRNWASIDELSIKPSVSLKKVQEKERQLGITFPKDFTDVLLNYSAGVDFYFQIAGEKPKSIYRQIFSAGDQLWDFDSLDDIKENYDGWVKECFNNPSNNYDKVWHHKVPFIHVATGDIIALDVSNGVENCPVIFLSHDGSDMHGARLGYNFIDFISRWSNIGCFGPEDWQFEPFYDREYNMLMNEGPVIENWKNGFLK